MKASKLESAVFRPFVASSENVEVDGRAMLAVVSGMMIRKVGVELLEREGFSAIHPEQWYSQQKWLNVFKRISERLGPDTLYSVGYRIPYSADFPAERMRDVPSALECIDIAYHNAHRHGEIGCYEYSQLQPGVYQIRCNNPYPCDFDHGIVCSIVERFRGSQQFSITHAPESCRKQGGSECRYIVMHLPK